MHGHRTFLLIGSADTANIIGLIKGGHELSNCNFSFLQGIDNKGKATTRVYAGTIHVTLPQLPPKDVIEWGIKSRKYQDGAIVILDSENLPLQKIFFKNAACIDIDIEYTQAGESYASTQLVIHAEKILVGNGIDFSNEWIK